jgi:hypothetical protein
VFQYTGNNTSALKAFITDILNGKFSTKKEGVVYCQVLDKTKQNVVAVPNDIFATSTVPPVSAGANAQSSQTTVHKVEPVTRKMMDFVAPSTLSNQPPVSVPAAATPQSPSGHQDPTEIAINNFLECVQRVFQEKMTQQMVSNNLSFAGIPFTSLGKVQ